MKCTQGKDFTSGVHHKVVTSETLEKTEKQTDG